MKTAKFWLLSMVLAACQATAEPADFGKAITAKLNSYSLEDVEADDARRNNNLSTPRMDAMEDDLTAAVKYYKRHPLTEDAAEQMLRAILLAQAFDSAAGGEAIAIVIPLYDAKTAVFKKALRRLHPFDRKFLEDWFPSYCRRNCG